MDPQHFRLPSIGDLVGDYRIVDLIGNGGQGHVYRAEASGRAYAVKFLDPGLDRFGTREVQALMTLTELRLPGVVRFIACGRWPDRERGLLYVVMEYVEGLTLYDYVMVHNPSARKVGELVLSLGRTLIAVQEAGVLHRDVKRENIMVRLPSEEPVVLDFGLAALRGANSGEGFSQVTGTLEYLSPEAWRHAGSEDARYRPTAKDEQWALGVTFYWLLTDRLPFGVREDPLMTRRVLREAPRPPHVLNPRVPPELGAVCMRLLEKNPEDRYAGLGEMCGELRRVLEPSVGVERWEVPLGDPDAPECRTTEIDATRIGPEGMDLDFRHVRAPRRGRYVKLRPPPPVPLPEPEGAAPAPVAVAVAVAVPLPVPVEAHPGPLGGRQRVLAAFQGAARRAASWTMMLALGLFIAPLAADGPSRPVAWASNSGDPLAPGPGRRQPAGDVVSFVSWQVGTPVQKLEIPLRPPESEADAISTPVSVAKATNRKDAPVKALKKCVGAICCAAMVGCTGPSQNERQLPPPEDCPPGSTQAMEKYGIDSNLVLPPNEGYTEGANVRLLLTHGLFGGGYVEGRVYFGDGRVYGRFVKLVKGKLSVPICMALANPDTRDWGIPANTSESPAKFDNEDQSSVLLRVTSFP